MFSPNYGVRFNVKTLESFRSPVVSMAPDLCCVSCSAAAPWTAAPQCRGAGECLRHPGFWRQRIPHTAGVLLRVQYVDYVLFSLSTVQCMLDVQWFVLKKWCSLIWCSFPFYIITWTVLVQADYAALSRYRYIEREGVKGVINHLLDSYFSRWIPVWPKDLCNRRDGGGQPHCQGSQPGPPRLPLPDPVGGKADGQRGRGREALLHAHGELGRQQRLWGVSVCFCLWRPYYVNLCPTLNNALKWPVYSFRRIRLIEVSCAKQKALNCRSKVVLANLFQSCLLWYFSFYKLNEQA